MPTELKLPLLGDVMQEGTLAVWLKPDGAHVSRGEPVYQLETDKVTYAVEAPTAGVLRHIVAEGTVVPVGTVVGEVLDAASAGVSAAPAASAAVDATKTSSGESAGGQESDELRASPAARRVARELGVDLAARGSGRRIREADVRAFADAHAAGTSESPSQIAGAAASGRATALAPSVAQAPDVPATPAARRLARERGIELASLSGGRLLRAADVLAASDGQPKESQQAIAIAGQPSVAGQASARAGQPLSGRRRVIAERMHASLQQMAQLTISMEVDFSGAVELREQLKALWPNETPTITDVVMRAAALALAQHPELNATLEKDELVQHQDVHVGLAVDADDGLIVPVIRQAGAVTLRELSARTREAAARARANQLQLQDLQGGTFTVTTLGQLGVDFFTPIINPPQVAILGIGRVFPKLVRAETGEMKDTQAVHLSLSFDHRAVDGAPAARFLQEVKRLLELPAALIV
jgi:pyruvate dehydrogenase E2 component (dihydrolipoamide acetyltransferase)